MERGGFTRQLSTFLLLSLFLFWGKIGHTTHAQGADLTYTCLGNNEYEVQASFYRDCEGINAPATVDVDISSDNCNENLSITLDQVPGTGQEVTPVCDSITTECDGGSHPGVEEYVYTGTITLPQACSDWSFDMSICCRNNAITTIDDPGNQDIHLQSELDNLNYPCNNSPTFNNPPVPYTCVGETYCFNHGAQDPDGDSLSYSLVTPSTGPNGTVDYLQGYSATQPVNSNPQVSIDPETGDICMTPTQQEVSVLEVRVEEWRNGNMIGAVHRDIQVQVINCSNQLPSLSGIDGTGEYQMEVCANENVFFEIPTQDPDGSQDLTLSWDQGISGGQFDPGTGSRPTGQFQWTPDSSHVGNGPHCFTVEVKDDNCPINGSQVYAFCLTVNGIDSLALSSQPANCGASNGSAHVDQVYGSGGPFSYNWQPATGNNQSADYMGIPADTYTVEVSDTSGCSFVDSIAVGPGSMPGNLGFNTTDPDCHGGSNGSATVNVQGGQGPYNYDWSTGDTTATADNLGAGTYYVDVVTEEGCHSSDTVTIQEPPELVLSIDSLAEPLCFGDSNGYGEASVQGGQPPYDFEWSTSPPLNGQQVSDLYAGNFTVTVTDGNGCMDSASFTLNQPDPLSSSMNSTDVSCNGGSDGSATVNVGGGTGPYQYDWMGYGVQQSSMSGLSAGQYVVEVTDQNGCSIHDTAIVDEPAPLAIDTLNMTDPTCHGSDDGSISTSVSGGASPYSYNWMGINQSSSDLSDLHAGTYVLEVTDANGCAAVDSFELVDPAPVQVTVDQVFDVSCNGGEDGMATATASGGQGPYSIQWNVDSPQTGNSAFDLSAGSYTVTATDANGCEATTSFVVDEPAPMDLSVNPLGDTICPNDTITLSASATGGNGNYFFVWDQGLGVGSTHDVSPNQTTDYSVIAYDSTGCASEEVTVSIEVRELDRSKFEVHGGEEICKGEMGTIWASYNDEGADVDFSWDQGIGNGEGPHHVLPNDTTTYTVTVSDPCQNQLTDSVTVPVLPIPKVSVEVPDVDSCGEASVICKNDTNTASSTAYEWKFSNGETRHEEEPKLQFNSSGQHSAKLYLTNQHGCENMDGDQFEVTIHPIPSADFDMDPEESTSIMEPEFAFHYNDPYAMEWTFDFGDGDSSNKRDPVHEYDEVGTYDVTLSAKTIYGCEAEKTKEIVVEEKFAYYVPNAFTPDGDGVNDEFDGEGTGYVAREMMIFNRWGELVFESTNPEEGWDGTVNGNTVRPDTYVYKIKVQDLHGNWHEKEGHVTVVR